MHGALALLAREAERHVGRTALPLIGDRHIERAAHLKITDRPFTSDAVSAAQAEEDSYRAITASTVTRKRTKKGTSSRVTRYGRSVVIGDSYPSDVDGSRVPAMVIEHAIDTTRRTKHGADGIALARIATLAYDLPDLIGGEFKSWSEVLPADVGMLVGGTYALHNTGAYIAAGDTKVSWPTRYRMPTVRVRSGERRHRTVTFHDGQSVTRLLSPCADVRVDIEQAPSDHHRAGRVIAVSAPSHRAFMGHRAYERPTSSRQARVGRSRQTDHVLLTDRPLVDIEHLATHIGKGEHITFVTSDRSVRGTLSCSPSGRLNAVVGETKVRSARTVGALLKHLAPTFA